MIQVKVHDAKCLIGVKPMTVIGIGEKAYDVLPKNAKDGIIMVFMDEDTEIELRLRPIKKLPYPERRV